MKCIMVMACIIQIDYTYFISGENTCSIQFGHTVNHLYVFCQQVQLEKMHFLCLEISYHHIYVLSEVSPVLACVHSHMIIYSEWDYVLNLHPIWLEISYHSSYNSHQLNLHLIHPPFHHHHYH